LTQIGVVSASLITTASNHEQRLGQLENKSASVDTSITNINTFTQSVNDRFTTLGIYTGSVNSDLTSIHQTTASLNLFTASAYVSFSLMTASIDDHEDRITYVEGTLGITGGNPLVPLNAFSASAKISIANLEAATGSYETMGRGIISGSSQLSGTTITDLTILNLTTISQTASVIFSSGSNKFGDFSNDIHSFTGSVEISGSLTTIGTQTLNSFTVLSNVGQNLNFANDDAAAIGGVPLYGLYRNGNFIVIRLT
jgi:hypothetical protein